LPSTTRDVSREHASAKTIEQFLQEILMRRVGFLLVLFLLPVLVGYFISPPFSSSGYRQLRLGMEKREVELLMGKPSKIDEQFWSYSQEGRIGWLDLSFDSDDRLSGLDVESVWTDVFGK